MCAPHGYARLVVDSGALEAPCQVRRHIAPAEVLDRDLLTTGPGSQRRQDLLDRMVERRRLGRPARPHEHDPGALRAVREHREEIHRGLVAPVQVFQDQHQRLVGRDRLHQPRELAQHLMRRRVDMPAPCPSRARGPLQRRICRASQLGATARRADRSRSRDGPWLSRSRASSTGMYGSRSAYCSTHWPYPIRTGSGAARADRRNASTIALLPIPGSPWMKTT